MNNGIDEIEKTTEVTNPFDEELEDNVIINDTYFMASRDTVALDGMQFSFMKPPYIIVSNFRSSSVHRRYLFYRNGSEL